MGSFVGAVFLGAAWILVFRRDDATVEHAGLAFGGLVLPSPIDRRRVVDDGRVALTFATLAAMAAFVPFYFGFRAYARIVWHAHPTHMGGPSALSLANDAISQVALVALPEEVFYRGYLQSRLDGVWSPRLRVLGATVGPSLLATSAIFALGHVLTIHDPARLAVFFPSLLFGWLRARTGGVGASILFHAACNVFSGTLLVSYGAR